MTRCVICKAKASLGSDGLCEDCQREIHPRCTIRSAGGMWMLADSPKVACRHKFSSVIAAAKFAELLAPGVSIEYTTDAARALWDEFDAVELGTQGEIDRDWLHFEEGTHYRQVLAWFERHGVSFPSLGGVGQPAH